MLLKPKISKLLLSSALTLFLSSNVFAAGFLDEVQIKNDAIQIVESEENKNTLAGNFLAAKIASSDNDAEGAVEYYKNAIEQDPESINLKQSLFVALTSTGAINEAMVLLQEIPQESADKPINKIVAASDALKKKSWSRALSLIDVIEGTDLDSMTSKLFGSWSLYGERKIDEAIERAEEVSGPDWTKVIKNYHVGLMLSGVDRNEEAIPFFEAAIENKAVAAALTETYIRAVEALVRAHARAGDKEKAQEVLTEGLRLLPSHPPLLALNKKMKTEEAIAPLVATAQNGAAEIFFNVGSAISRQGGLPFAQSHLQLASFLNPTSHETMLSLANVYEEQKNFVKANSYYAQIPEDSPYIKRAQLETGLNLNQMKKTDEAIDTLKSLVENNPEDLGAVGSLGRVYAQHRKYDDAVTLYDETIPILGEVKTHHWPIYYRRGIAHERTKNWELAEPDFRKALELSPVQSDVLNYLGYSLVDMGIKLDEGLDMIRKAVELRPNSGFIIDSLGWAYYRLGRYEEAAVELERALELMPTDPVVNDHLGDAYWKIGRKLEATFLWKHALGNKPEEKDRIKIEQKLKEGLVE